MEKIKLYGERNTGTNYLAQLIDLNFNISLLTGSFPRVLNRWPLSYEWVRDAYFEMTFPYNYGWKHAMAPSKEILKKMSTSDIIFLTLTKNPYAWLLSMYHRPYHHNKLYSGFDQFLLTPYPTVNREHYSDGFSNPVEMWNKKNASYLCLMSYVNGMALRYEDFLSNAESMVSDVQIKFNLQRKSSLFVNIYQASKKQDAKLNHEYYKEYYLKNRWADKLTTAQIALINELLDKQVMGSFGYAYL